VRCFPFMHLSPPIYFSEVAPSCQKVSHLSRSPQTLNRCSSVLSVLVGSRLPGPGSAWSVGGSAPLGSLNTGAPGIEALGHDPRCSFPPPSLRRQIAFPEGVSCFSALIYAPPPCGVLCVPLRPMRLFPVTPLLRPLLDDPPVRGFPR